jgi:surface protein
MTMKHLVYALFISVILQSCGTENKPVFTLATTASPSEGGSIIPATGQFTEGEIVTLTATPASNGWRFVRWDGEWTGDTNPLNLGMTRDYNIIGIFEKRDYPLTVSIIGEGTVQESVIQQKTTEYTYQTTVLLTPQPAEGWQFAGWSGDISGNQVPATIIMNGVKSVTANFVKKTYSIEVSVEGNGSVKIHPEQELYEHGTTVTITPQPDTLWAFKEWSGDVSGTTALLEITISSPLNMTAIFERKNYPLTITIEGEGSVSERVILQKTTEYPYGTRVELTPIASEGWRFLEWSGDLRGDEVPIEISVTEPRSVGAVFEPSFFMAENEITIMCPMARVGEKGQIGGVIYEAVDRNLLIRRRDEGLDLTKVCTSLITDMSGIFSGISIFNQNISNWDVSNVTNMRGMFQGASIFNQPIGIWDVGNVIIMENMFHGNYRSYVFNQDLNDWNVSSVKIMDGMFYRASTFNSRLDKWDVSNVVTMHAMFLMSGFNHPIENWDVSNVTNMVSMFAGSQFNQPIENWDVSNVTNMVNMFAGSQFNQPIENWDVSRVNNMRDMFASSPFNQMLDSWDVSNVTNMNSMFRNSPFNQPIGNWDVSNVSNMTEMFWSSRFNQNISSWCVTRILSEPNGFSSPFLMPDFKPLWGTCPTL